MQEGPEVRHGRRQMYSQPDDRCDHGRAGRVRTACGGDVVVPAGTGADSLTTEDSQNGDQIDRTYLFSGTSVGSAVLEVVQSDDTASVQEGQQHMQAAKDYSDNHTEIPYFVIAGVFLLLLILLIWRIVKIVKL